MPGIVDADGHVLENEDFVSEAVKRWPDQIQLRMEDGQFAGFVVEGRLYPEPPGPGMGCPAAHSIAPDANPATAASMLADVDRDQIDRMVLFPSIALFGASIRDRRLARDFATLYSEWLADFCADSGGRLFGAAVLPAEEVSDAIQVMKEARARGAVSAILPPALRTRNLDHPDLDPLYAAAVDLDLPISIHGAPGIHLPKIGTDRFDNYIQVHCISFPFDQMTAMTAIVSGGVLERHPRLRVGFLEAGVTWVPYFVDRLHEHYEKRGDWIPGGWRREPREYLERGQIYVACEPDETVLPAVIGALGDEFILYASDYPHWDGEWPESTRALRERRDIGEGSREKILRRNAERFFGLE